MISYETEKVHEKKGGGLSSLIKFGLGIISEKVSAIHEGGKNDSIYAHSKLANLNSKWVR
jgi:hypothetical protein